MSFSKELIDILTTNGEGKSQRDIYRGNYKDEYIQFLVNNLICPITKSTLKHDIDSEALIPRSDEKIKYPIIDGVPCFISTDLSTKQLAEDESLQRFIPKIEEVKHTFYKSRIQKQMDLEDIANDSKVVVIGGSFFDNTPQIKSLFKWNVDHCAVTYQNFNFPASFIEKQGGFRHIHASSANLPFPDNYADIVYIRNALDHFDAPIRALLEINRILKPGGKFYLSVYYNSHFDDANESIIIDDVFFEQHIVNLFKVEYKEISKTDDPSGIKIPMEKYSKPEFVKMDWLTAVLVPKDDYIDYDLKQLDSSEKFIRNFESAIFWDKKAKLNPKFYKKAKVYYKKVMESNLFFSTDKYRQFYSKIRYYSITNQKKLMLIFEKLPDITKDVWWWKLVIGSSVLLHKDYLLSYVESNFKGEKYSHLKTYIGSLPKFLRIRYFIKKFPIIHHIIRNKRLISFLALLNNSKKLMIC